MWVVCCCHVGTSGFTSLIIGNKYLNQETVASYAYCSHICAGVAVFCYSNGFYSTVWSCTCNCGALRSASRRASGKYMTSVTWYCPVLVLKLKFFISAFKYMLVMCLNITCICGIKCAIELKFDDASDALLQVFSVFFTKRIQCSVLHWLTCCAS